jgi:chemotaxis protein MotB
MRPCSTHSGNEPRRLLRPSPALPSPALPSPTLPSPTSARSIGRLALALFGSCALALGCVTSGAHEQVVKERDGLVVAKRDLKEQVRLLKIANNSLDEHVAKLVDEREDLLENREFLEKNLRSTRETKAALASSLKTREEELAVTAAALVAQSARVNELQGTYEGLVGDLEEEVAKGQIRVSQLQDGLQVGVSQDILFPSGSARLNREGIDVLKTVASRLADLDYAIAVEGHSDDQPISGGLKKRYPTNWELAGARASSVVRLFAEQGLDAANLTAVSHGSTRPIADNSTPEGRALNRRIEIRLRPIGADDVVEPSQ